MKGYIFDEVFYDDFIDVFKDVFEGADRHDVIQEVDDDGSISDPINCLDWILEFEINDVTVNRIWPIMKNKSNNYWIERFITNVAENDCCVTFERFCLPNWFAKINDKEFIDRVVEKLENVRRELLIEEIMSGDINVVAKNLNIDPMVVQIFKYILIKIED